MASACCAERPLESCSAAQGASFKAATVCSSPPCQTACRAKQPLSAKHISLKCKAVFNTWQPSVQSSPHAKQPSRAMSLAVQPQCKVRLALQCLWTAADG